MKGLYIAGIAALVILLGFGFYWLVVGTFGLDTSGPWTGEWETTGSTLPIIYLELGNDADCTIRFTDSKSPSLYFTDSDCRYEYRDTRVNEVQLSLETGMYSCEQEYTCFTQFWDFVYRPPDHVIGYGMVTLTRLP